MTPLQLETPCPYCSGIEVYVERPWPANDYVEHPENWLGMNFEFAHPTILQLVCAALAALPIKIAHSFFGGAL